MKKPYIIIGVIAFLILLVILLILHRSPQSLTVSQPFAGNLRFADTDLSADSDSIRFFTGNQFAEYDLKTHTTSNLTPFMELPAVTNVKWGNKGVLFKASNYSDFDQLKPQVEEKFLPANGSYWWVVAYGSAKPTLVGEYELNIEAGDVVWQNDDTYLYVEPLNDHDGEVHALNRAKIGGETSKIGEFSTINRLLWSNQEYVYALGPDSLLRINLGSGESEVVINERLVNPQVSSDGSSVAYIEHENHSNNSNEHPHMDDPGTVIYHDLSTREEHRVIKDFAGSIFPALDNEFLAVSKKSEDKLFTIRRFDKERGDYYSFEQPEGEVIVYFHDMDNSNQYLLRDVNNSAYMLAPKNASVFQDLPSLTLPRELIDSKNIYKDSYYMSYFPDKKSYAVYAISGNLQRIRLESIEYFESQNVDYRQIPVKWYPAN